MIRKWAGKSKLKKKTGDRSQKTAGFASGYAVPRNTGEYHQE